jgi:hypothetical protein
MPETGTENSKDCFGPSVLGNMAIAAQNTPEPLKITAIMQARYAHEVR